MPRNHLSGRAHKRGWLVALIAVLALSVGAGTATSAPSAAATAAKPTIVLVHGAWADASGWNDVTQRLQRQGYNVLATANPLGSLATDAAYLKSILDTIVGPVVLVGHSYGGMVMTNAAFGDPDVTALVYIAGFAPAEGETVGGLSALFPGSLVGPETLTFRPHPGGLDVYITPTAFRDVFAADVQRRTTDVMGASQRPIEAAVLGEPSGPPAWLTIPSWYMVATEDKTIPPDAERFMAERAGATTVEVAASHSVMISKPAAVTDLIVTAARAVG